MRERTWTGLCQTLVMIGQPGRIPPHKDPDAIWGHAEANSIFKSVEVAASMPLVDCCGKSSKIFQSLREPSCFGPCPPRPYKTCMCASEIFNHHSLRVQKHHLLDSVIALLSIWVQSPRNHLQLWTCAPRPKQRRHMATVIHPTLRTPLLIPAAHKSEDMSYLQLEDSVFSTATWQSGFFWPWPSVSSWGTSSQTLVLHCSAANSSACLYQ